MLVVLRSSGTGVMIWQRSNAWERRSACISHKSTYWNKLLSTKAHLQSMAANVCQMSSFCEHAEYLDSFEPILYRLGRASRDPSWFEQSPQGLED